MNKILDFIERHKYGILATLVVHVGIFVYFQVATYTEIVRFESWEFTSAQMEAPDDIEISAEQIETQEERELYNPQEEITSFVKNQNDSRERSQKDNVNYTSYYKTSPEQMERDYEQSVKDEIRRQREKLNAKKVAASSTDHIDNENDKTSKKTTSQNSNSSSEAVKGKTMVSYSLLDRHPLNHNDWNIRNPGYTCGNINGIVTVSISVDVGGIVTSATVIDAESHGATPCMIQRAREYALKSRFNYAGNAPKKQEGTITYRFVYRE